MVEKSRLNRQIHILQAQARRVCRTCAFSKTAQCKGSVCTDITRIIKELDPLVSAYFRLELAEIRDSYGSAHINCVWQQCLPFETSAAPPNTSARNARAIPTEISLSNMSVQVMVEDEDAAVDTADDTSPGLSTSTLIQLALGWEKE